MIRFDIIALFPEMFHAITHFGMTRRAILEKHLELYYWNPRDYVSQDTTQHYQRVDDRSYGGGPGMVMQVAPLRKAIQAARAADPRPALCIYLSPQGKPLQQAFLVTASQTLLRIILVCGRYEGIDQRLIDADIDEQWSIGDYVLSGGELGAMVIIDAITRLIPGVLGDDESSVQESFMSGLLDYPHYTRPPEIDGQRVPEVLLSGDHAAIARWRLKQQLWHTQQQRPDILAQKPLSEEQQILLTEAIQEHRSEA